MNIAERLAQKARLIERHLRKLLPSSSQFGQLNRAMRYSVLSGGKRVRPFLILEAARVCGGREDRAMPLACAVEMIHTYSLVHDDLPEMDNDDFRRGRKTCHREFDVATAILAGDALLSYAFQIMSEADSVDPKRKNEVMRVVSEAVGPFGMVGGQALDLKHRSSSLNLKIIRRINRFKTGALIRVCLRAGAIWGGGSRREIEALTRYGESVGFLFQLVDDIIDRNGYVRLMGVKEAYRRASALKNEAKRRIGDFGCRGRTLADFADFLYKRKQ